MAGRLWQVATSVTVWMNVLLFITTYVADNQGVLERFGLGTETIVALVGLANALNRMLRLVDPKKGH